MTRARRNPLPWLAFILALAILAAEYVLLGTPLWTIVVVVLLSVVTNVVYLLDKRAARRTSRRVSESTLHGLALVGGWPGAFIAQQSYRHKTVKASFQVAFWLTVAANLAVLAVLTANGRIPAEFRFDFVRF